MKNILFIISLIILSSCAGSKAAKYLKQGSVTQQNFKTIIPFEYKNGLIVIKVQIQEETYDFILDTGSSNIISENLNNKLKTVLIGSEDVQDIYGDTQKLRYTRINKIKIGNIDFLKTISAITNFNNQTSLSCLKVDGIIGSNLMRHAIWDIDFESKAITITNTEDNLKIPVNHKESKFFIGYAGIPSITSKVNGKTVLNNIVDLGYNGGIILPLKTFKNQKGGKISKWIKSYGFGPTSIYGTQKNIISYNSKIDEIQLGNLVVKNRIVYSAPMVDNLLGIDFFKNYRIIMNWKKKRIKMIETTPLNKKNILNYGFNYSFKDNIIYISKLTEKSNASQHLKLGDQIVSINNKNYLEVKESEWCKIIEGGLFNESKNKVTISILRDKNKMTFQLEKEEFLN